LTYLRDQFGGCPEEAIRAPVPGDEPLRRQPAADARGLSGYPAPVVRNAGAERELIMMRWGMPASAACGRLSRHQHPQHHFAPLARLVKAGKSLPGTVQQLRRVRAGAEPAKKKDVVWFALNDDRPLTAFAGVWTEFKGDRGTKSKPIPGPHLV
jgi:hypothetical protein